MKRFYSWGLILLCALLLAGCSSLMKNLEEVMGKDKSEATKPAEKSASQAEDLLDQMKKEMKKISGYIWESQGEQQMDISDGGMATTTFQNRIDYLDTSHYAMDIDLKMNAGKINNIIDIEVIRDGDIVYFYEPFLEEWVRTREVPEEMMGMMGMEYFDPDELVSLLSPHASQITVEEEGQHWKLTLKLKDHEEIIPFMKFAIENYQRNDDVKSDAVAFSDLKMTVMLNKSDRQLTQVEQSIKIEMPMTSGDLVDVSQSWTNKFKGEVKELTIPAEAKNAPFADQ